MAPVSLGRSRHLAFKACSLATSCAKDERRQQDQPRTMACSEEVEMLLALLSILLFLFDVKPDYSNTDGKQADCANEHDQIECIRGRDEELKSPIKRISSVHEDNQLGVGDDGSPHVLNALSINRIRRIEILDVVVRATNTKVGKR